MVDKYSLMADLLVFSGKVKQKSAISIGSKHIIGYQLNKEKNLNLDSRSYVYPAIINVHDHLRGDYLPKIGPANGKFYKICAEWEKDLRASAVLEERSKLSEEECYWLGAYKNLFSGVVTVNDHYPHAINDKYIPQLPIRVIQNYTLHHEATSHSLDWGEGIEVEHRKAVKNLFPFIIHLEEGFDQEYQQGVELLEELGCLDACDLLVHCIGFSEEDIKKIEKAGASVVWCPASNVYMYNVTCKIRKMLQAGVNVSIGTDSTHTGSINILEEIRFAREIYKKMYGEDLDPKLIFNMVTINPAKAFKMDDWIGSLDQGKSADILVLEPKRDDPYEALVEAQLEDVTLLTREGRPILGAKKYKDFFALNAAEYSEVEIRGREKFVIGDPNRILKEIHKKIGYAKILDYMPLENF